MMAVAYLTLETPDMYVAILTVSICGYALDRTLLAARRRLLTWSAAAGADRLESAVTKRLQQHLDQEPKRLSKESVLAQPRADI